MCMKMHFFNDVAGNKYQTIDIKFLRRKGSTFQFMKMLFVSFIEGRGTLLTVLFD